MTYFKYAERQVDTQINWAEIGKSLSDTLKAEATAREAKKEAIDQASREFAQTLANAPTGLYEAGNQFASNIANDASAYRLMTDRLLKSGQLKLKDYTAGRQNINDDVSTLFDLAQEYQDEYKVKMDRWKAGKSAYREVFQMEQAEGLANIRDVKGYINPATGNVSLGKMVKNPTTGVMEMSKNPNDRATVNELRNRLKSQYDRYDVNEAAAQRVEVLGVIEESIIQYAGEGSLNTIITKIDAKQGNYALDKDAQQFVADYKAWEDLQVESMMDIPYHIESVLTDMKNVAPNGEQYTFTYDREEFEAQGEDGNLIFLDTSKDANGTPEFNERQRKAVEESMRIAIRAQIDVKKQAKAAGMTPYEPEAKREAEDQLQADADALTEIAKLWYGDKNAGMSALSFLSGLDRNKDFYNYDRTKEGLKLYFTDENGKESYVDLTFNNADGSQMTQEEFIKSAASRLGGVTNVDEALKKSKYKKDAKFNESSYSFKIKSDKRLGFDEAFDKNEAPKLNAQKVLVNTGAAITGQQEDAAVQAMQSQIGQIPGANKITTRAYSSLARGRGLVITLPGSKNTPAKTYYVELSNKDKAATQYEEVKQAIVAYARNQQSFLLDDKGKESYIDQYGVVKAGGGELD